MIETYKITSGIYDREVTEGFLKKDQGTRTRGHSEKLQKGHCRLNLRKYSFTNRIVDTWNSLPQYVISSKSVKSFEANLDKHWENIDVKYDYNASITSTDGSHVKSRNSTVKAEVDKVAN
ncbi:hypothetical protein FSP39_016640 [Pinctada imbricata]|uniref:Uncharacterized protein n=1 Tax=Pinctada imbricata TaxID=66713 RepID=A0AA88XSS2_PINIB|nr:hypothetical protein FSP39_016640 [Pinctada imbricata]